MPLYYERSNIRIHHGDCLSILPELPAESVDFVLTDPPYLVDYKGRWDGDKRAIVGDDDPAWLRPAFAELFRVLKDDTFAVSFYGWPHADVFVGTFKEVGFRLVSHLAFVKNVWGLGRFTRGQHETAYLLAKGKPPAPASGISDVFEWTRERDPVHPNQKPEGALRKILSTYAAEGGLVLDPFMGSGSTFVAAKSLGMSGLGIEIEERYCRLAVSRLAQEVLFV
jgi:site-specific DNA-methyltransferase (adenine-specific)